MMPVQIGGSTVHVPKIIPMVFGPLPKRCMRQGRPADPDGKVLSSPTAKHIFGMRDSSTGRWFTTWGLVTWWGRGLILGVYGIGCPFITGSINIRAGIWTPEREALVGKRPQKGRPMGLPGHFTP
jgi:hypothetical protein